MSIISCVTVYTVVSSGILSFNYRALILSGYCSGYQGFFCRLSYHVNHILPFYEGVISFKGFKVFSAL